MKRTTTILVFILFLMVTGYFIYVQTRPVADNIFHVEETSQIARIELTKVIKGEASKELSLTKQEQDWLVNEEFTVVPDKIEAFLNTLGGIRVRENIENEGQETALAILKKNHTLVRILDADEDVLVAYLLGPTDSKHKSNIMMVEGGKRAYLVSKPGLDGYVSVQYQMDPLEWREKLLWNLNGSDLARIEADYLSVPEESYRLERESDGVWRLGAAMADGRRVEDYLRLFTGKVYAETFADMNFPGLRDSLSRRTPDISFGYGTQANQSGTLHLFLRPENQNNYFGYLEGKPEAYTVQHFVIDKFLKRRTYFGAGS